MYKNLNLVSSIFQMRFKSIPISYIIELMQHGDGQTLSGIEV